MIHYAAGDDFVIANAISKCLNMAAVSDTHLAAYDVLFQLLREPASSCSSDVISSLATDIYKAEVRLMVCRKYNAFWMIQRIQKVLEAQGYAYLSAASIVGSLTGFTVILPSPAAVAQVNNRPMAASSDNAAPLRSGPGGQMGRTGQNSQYRSW